MKKLTTKIFLAGALLLVGAGESAANAFKEFALPKCLGSPLVVTNPSILSEWEWNNCEGKKTILLFFT